MTDSQESVVAMTLSLMTHFIGETSDRSELALKRPSVSLSPSAQPGLKGK